ncbi:MAG: DNA-binding response regulator [Marinilabiliales bacterium]|nr:MAG: DNA-binding response regulator [Marinilabiliales bacterium]
MSQIKIILVEDHQIVRDGIKSLLANSIDIEIVNEAENAYELFEILKTDLPDIILLDISLPTMSGIEIAKILAREFPSIKILMLSMYTSEDFVFNALKAGIKGYLPKNITRYELILAINEVYKGNEYFSKSISDTILKSYINNAKLNAKSSSEKLDNLTLREKEILRYVAEGYNNNDIVERLNISIRTVETHKTNIMKKLELHNVVELVKFAIKNNIIEI